MIGGADLQAVLVRFLAPYLKHHTLAPQLRQVCEYLRVCRTAVLGGLRLSCDHCGAEPPQYHACRDRHCPDASVAIPRPGVRNKPRPYCR